MNQASYDWIGRVAQKHKQFSLLAANEEELKTARRRVGTDFVCSSLRLEAVDADEAQVAIVFDSTRAERFSETEALIAEQAKALRTIDSFARNEPEALLTPELLLKIRGQSEFRRAEHLDASLRSACFWFSAESFLELNPVEQAAIVLLRLVEIRPFDDRNDSTSLVAASLFLLRSSLPPIIVRRDQTSKYRQAIEEGRQSNTRPMVEFVAEATERTIDEMIALVAARR
jgi:hypothetical protein